MASIVTEGEVSLSEMWVPELFPHRHQEARHSPAPRELSPAVHRLQNATIWEDLHLQDMQVEHGNSGSDASSHVDGASAHLGQLTGAKVDQ